MHTGKRAIATTELLLILPATLFMTALVVRTLQPLQNEPARTAERIVMWYAERQWTLWILLIALPLAVLVTGCAALMRNNARETLAAIRAHPAALLIAAATLTAGVFLVIVVLCCPRSKTTALSPVM
jgi:hypothetical protein